MNKYIIEIRWAVIFFVVQLTWMALERIVGLHDQYIDQHAIYTNFFGLLAVLLYVWALLDKRKNYYQGKMTYQQGFMAGLIMTIVITLLSPVGQYLISVAISPEYFNNAIAYVVIEGKMTAEEAEAYFNLSSYMTQATFGALMMGILTTAIVAIFVRKK